MGKRNEVTSKPIIIREYAPIIFPSMPKIVRKFDRKQWDKALSIIYNKHVNSSMMTRKEIPDFVKRFISDTCAMSAPKLDYSLAELSKIRTSVDAFLADLRHTDLETIILDSSQGKDGDFNNQELSMLHEIMLGSYRRKVPLKKYSQFRETILGVPKGIRQDTISVGSLIEDTAFKHEDPEQRGDLLIAYAKALVEKIGVLGNKFRPWVDKAIASPHTITDAISYFNDRHDYYKDDVVQIMGGLPLSGVKGRLLSYVHALTGEPIKIKKIDSPDLVCSFDGTSFLLPPAINREVDNEKNLGLYRALCSYQAATMMFGTYPQEEEKEGGVSFDDYTNPQVAKLLFEMLEFSRLDPKLNEKFPGLSSDTQRLKRHLVKRVKEKDVLGNIRNYVLSGISQIHDKGLEKLLNEAVSALGKNDASVADTKERVKALYKELESRYDLPTETEIQSILEINPEIVINKVSKKASHLVASASDELTEGKRFKYQEWDFEKGCYKPEFAQVVETEYPGVKDNGYVLGVLETDRDAIKTIRETFERIAPEEIRRVTKQVSGDVNYDALVKAKAEIKAGITPDEKVFDRRYKNTRSVTSMVLSESSGSLRTFLDLENPDLRTIDLIKRAQIYFAESLDIIGDNYALASFSGETERNVEFYLIKDFGQEYDSATRRAIGSIKPLKQNRDGAGVRHATHLLSEEGERVRLLFYLMDGLPHDFNYEEDYAIEDTRRAIIESKNQGCIPIVISFGKGENKKIRSLADHCYYIEAPKPTDLPLMLPRVYSELAI